LDDEYDHYTWKLLSDIQQQMITNSTVILLNIGMGKSSGSDLVLDGLKTAVENTTFLIYSDGGSRGNPGPSAAAYIILDKNENIVTQGGKFLGHGDSGMAEYVGVELALQKAIELGAKNIEFRSDSLMVVNQLNGLFSVKNHEFRPIHDRIIQLMTQFQRINFRHVHREYNRMADGLVNKILDENE
jgi:ribonuclease HI